MSLWGATVITNLISAIPWIGQDIVESKNITIIINLYLGIFILFTVLVPTYKYFNILLLKTVSNNKALLPTIGVVHNNALKRGNKNLRLDKEVYLSIPSSFLAFLVGLIDGDGYIQITKTTKGFITIKLVISLHLEDLSTLEYIYSVLKIGKINIYKDLRSPTCRLVINKTDLQEVFFPLLLYNNIYFLTDTRVNQFNLAMYVLKNDIKLYDEIGDINNIPAIFNLPKNSFGYTLLPFFKNWIVGFTCSEGSFFIKNNNDGCFQLKQRIHTNLFESFKLVFNTDPLRSRSDLGCYAGKITTTNNYNQFGVSSKSDIQKVIDFFSFSGLHPLIGQKYIQYIKWLNNLRVSSRYGNLNYPK